MTEASITALYRYPVKGLSPDPLQQAEIRADETFSHDRMYAIENGSRDFDPIKPKYYPKAKFLQLMTNEQLAALETRFDAETQTLQILRSGKQVAGGNLSTPIGRQLVEQFLSAYLGGHARGMPHIVSAQGHHFADVPDNFISLINLESVRDIERVTGRPVDPLRFRGNIYVEGWKAWRELDLVGATLTINQTAMFKVEAAIDRCAAINVDPQTGARDMQLPRTLADVFGHDSCGIYLTALKDGTLQPNDQVSATANSSAGDNLGI
ncbi:MAG: MOSC domain-containing protein [Hyphomicrobiales bacterium]|nr:MOSC domain-containing protein [Hyphomicrobiales bacterium]